MPLINPLASLGCVAAAVAMLALSHDRLVRWAHIVMLAAMTVLLATMDDRPVVFGCALALGVTAPVLLRQRDRERRTCALDMLACAALLVLLGIGAAGPVPDTTMAMPAMTMPPVTSGADARLLAGALAVVLVWGAVAWRTSARRGVASWAAATVMLASMGAMTLA